MERERNERIALFIIREDTFDCATLRYFVAPLLVPPKVLPFRTAGRHDELERQDDMTN